MCVQEGDAADCGVDEGAVAFDKRIVGRVGVGDAVVDGGAGAKFAADVPIPGRRDPPSGEDGVQSLSCLLINSCLNLYLIIITLNYSY